MQAWQKFLAQQEIELGTETVEKWLRSLKVLRFDACNLYLEAKDTFQAVWFEEHIRQKTVINFLNNNNKKIKIHLSVANQKISSSPTKNKTKDEKTKGYSPKFELMFDGIDPYCNFENFVVPENNLLTYKVFSQLGNGEEDGAFNPIYVHGTAGTGKTHLLMALFQELRKRGLKVLYVRSNTFTEHVVTAIRAGEMSTFRQAYRNIDALIIDDVHLFSKKNATQEELFHTFNTLHLSGKQIILSSNCSPGELQHIEPRLVSRFEWGIVLNLEPLPHEEARHVIQRKAESLKFNLHPKVAGYLIETFTSNTKTLSKALEALILRAHLNKYTTPLTIPLAKHLLSDLVQEEQQILLTPKKIIQKTAEFFGIKMEDILGKSQSREFALPRQIAMFLCRSQLKMSFMKIGDFFSRDHSTVMSSVKLIQKSLDEDIQEIMGPFQSLIKKLRT